MIDSERHLHHLDRIAKKNKVELPVCIDLDMSIKLPGLHFGVFRSPVTNEKQAMKVVDKIIQCENIRLDSLMGYEAQIAGLGDNYRGKFLKNKAVAFLKANSIGKIAERRKNVVRGIEAKGLKMRVVNGGGTGSMESTCKEEVVSEVTVGSGFYSPGLFDNYRKFKYEPAAGYAVEIVRRPRNDIYTCHGGGYVASGACDPDKIPKPYLPTGAKLTANEAAGEVQTPVLYTGGQKLALGDPIFFRHSKAGELCERFNSLLVVSKGKVIDEVPSYRGEGKCFL